MARQTIPLGVQKGSKTIKSGTINSPSALFARARARKQASQPVSSGSSGSSSLPTTMEQAVRDANAANQERETQINSLFNQMLSNLQGVGQTQRSEINDAFALQQGQTQQDLISRGLYNTTTGAALPTFIEGRKQREITALEESLALGRNDVLGQKAGFLERITESAPSLADFFNQQAAAAAAPTSIPGPSQAAQQVSQQTTTPKLTNTQRLNALQSAINGTGDINAKISLLSSREAIQLMPTNSRLSQLNALKAQLAKQNAPAQQQTPVTQNLVAPKGASQSTLYSVYNNKTGERRTLTLNQFNSLSRSNRNWINQGPASLNTGYNSGR